MLGITSVGPVWADQLSKFLNKPARVIMNGYDGDLGMIPYEPEKGILHLCYVGTLYPTQPIERFLEGISTYIQAHQESYPVHLHFFGITIDPIAAGRIKKALQGREAHYTFYDRVPKNQLFENLKKVDLPVMLSHENAKGTLSSKIFEYLTMERPVLIFPDDQDAVSAVVRETNGGYVLNTSREVYEIMKRIAQEKKENGRLKIDFQIESISKYNRFNQAKIMGDTLDTYCHKK